MSRLEGKIALITGAGAGLGAQIVTTDPALPTAGQSVTIYYDATQGTAGLKDYTGDVYPKAATVLHTLRQIINDDDKWRVILIGLNTEFYHQTVTSVEIENYIAQQAGLDLKTFFNQYLRTIEVPTLEYYFKDNTFAYRWINAVPGFNMPLKVKLDNQEQWIHPTTSWTHEYTKDTKKELIIDPNFYVAGFKNMKT